VKYDVRQLPSDRFIKNLCESARASASLDVNKIMCELCDGLTPAQGFCQQCAQHTCKTCQRIHKKARSSQSHEFVTVDESLVAGLKGWRLLICTNHSTQEINSFCRDCQEAVCPQCAVDFHAKHDVAKVEVVATEARKEISLKVAQVCLPSFVDPDSLC